MNKTKGRSWLLLVGCHDGNGIYYPGVTKFEADFWSELMSHCRRGVPLWAAPPWQIPDLTGVDDTFATNGIVHYKCIS